MSPIKTPSTMIGIDFKGRCLPSNRMRSQLAGRSPLRFRNQTHAEVLGLHVERRLTWWKRTGFRTGFFEIGLSSRRLRLKKRPVLLMMTSRWCGGGPRPLPLSDNGRGSTLVLCKNPATWYLRFAADLGNIEHVLSGRAPAQAPAPTSSRRFDGKDHSRVKF